MVTMLHHGAFLYVAPLLPIGKRRCILAIFFVLGCGVIGNDAQVVIGDGLQNSEHPTQAPTQPDEVVFNRYEGQWVILGMRTSSMAYSIETSWSQSDSQTTANSFSHGMTDSVNYGYSSTLAPAEGVPGPSVTNSIDISHSCTEQWSQTVTNAITRTNGGSETATCTSIDCSEGTLYRWQITGYPEDPSIGEQFIRPCMFECIPVTASANTVPVCPGEFCGAASDDPSGNQWSCQCCRGVWAATVSESNICPAICEREPDTCADN